MVRMLMIAFTIGMVPVHGAAEGNARLVREAERWAENGYCEDARRLLDEALARDPMDLEARVVGVRLAIASGDIDRAIREFGAIPRRGPRRDDASLAAGIAVLDLAEALERGPAILRPRALLALRRQADRRSVERLAAIDWEEEPRAADPLLDLLSQREPHLRPLFAALAATGRADLVTIGAAGLASLGEAPAAFAVRTAIAEGRPEAAAVACEAAARAHLAETLTDLRFRARRKDEAAVAATAALAEITEDPRERTMAVRILRRIALAARTPRSIDGAVSIASLGRVGGPDALLALREIRANAPRWDRRAAAERSLARLGADEVAEALVEQIRTEDPTGAMAAAEALGALGANAPRERLRLLIDDPQSSARDAAAVALARAGGLSEGAPDIVARLGAARARGAALSRVEIASAVLAGRVEPAGLAAPRLSRALDIEVESVLDREARAEMVSSLCGRVVARLAELREAGRVEVAAPDLVVVCLRADLGARRLAEIARSLDGEGYSVLICEPPAGLGSSSNAEVPGPSP